jgi:hypothetical protein
MNGICSRALPCLITGTVGSVAAIIGITMLACPDGFPEHGRMAMACLGVISGLIGAILVKIQWCRVP